ncbi:Gfo/Idh/MocA family protein [Luteolibacter marinus]|uniref:Gfo/Idh/MocA family protein n=1 Tax=Luteolibacter marinus TaxID=2776705 RepID=UPI0018666BE5|nr:Gfo/Idh/MocA family oxidoreductase [Luteolibacter marinus]
MKRRHFLSTSAFAGTWSLLAPHARAQGANDDLRVAVIGLNGRGMAHVDGVIGAKGARLVALCDCDSKVLARAKEKVGKKGLEVTVYEDFRTLCESPDIDAVTIATPNHTHCLIAITAAANGKHVYVEKPVSHNVWEGRKLAEAQAKYGKVIQHGFQRRSETAWAEAFAWLAEGKLGKLTLARGFCYKPRPSIGKVGGPQKPPTEVNYDLWCGPRATDPPRRKQFHYDWHWQSPYGNGDLGNQGPHQLDVCRWALGDPQQLPSSVISCGGRFAHDDDGDVANTQIVFLGYEPAPILFEVRGLPKKDVDYKSGMDSYKGQQIGNIIEYEGGWLAGGHNAGCAVFDTAGKKIKEFKGGRSHFQSWVDSIRTGKQDKMLSAESGHLSSALAHIGNISCALGEPQMSRYVRESFTHPAAAEAVERMDAHLVANGVDLKKTGIPAGPLLTLDGARETFTGSLADRANALLKDPYRDGFGITV